MLFGVTFFIDLFYKKVKIQIIYNKNQIKKELSFVKDNIQHFKKNKMFFYFPFDRVSNKDNLTIDRQIEKDEEKFKIKIVKEKITKAWEEKESSVFNLLEKYNEGKNA